jgi:citrate lyase subunit beta/citryl-CoA lyase
MRALPSRRCCLSVPGGSDKMLQKAIGIAVDEIVFDLEDGVAIGAKDEARAKVIAALSAGGFAGRSIAVRVNAIGTAWCHADIIALGAVEHPGLTLVVPKVESAGDLAFLDRLLGGVESAGGRASRIGVQALIETAKGLSKVAEIAAASERLEALIIGYGDLASSLGRSPDAGWAFAQDAVLLAARTNGLQAIDGPYFALGDGAADGLAQASTRATQLGFDGKWAIHPNQIEAITAALTPSAEQQTHARALLARLDEAHAQGVGVVAFEGGMIDEAMRAGAERVLARAGGAR